jgi:hypothetical protein
MFWQQKPASAIINASASKGGVWNPLAKAMVNMLAQDIPGVTFADQETLGSLDNLKLLTAGKVQVVFAHDYHVARINQGLLTQRCWAGKINSKQEKHDAFKNRQSFKRFASLEQPARRGSVLQYLSKC